MKTKIVYLIFLFSLTTNLFAQPNDLAESNNGTKENTTRKSAISIKSGTAFPFGDFQYLNTSMPELDGGGVGTFVLLDYCLMITNRVSIIVGINQFNMSSNIETVYSGSVQYEHDGWAIIAALVGAGYSYPLWKFNIEPNVRMGFALNNPGTTTITQSGNTTVYEELAAKNSLAWQVGLDIAYPLSKRWDLNLNSAYFQSKYSNTNLHKTLSLLNLGLGMKFRF
jgi:hypothetical protein